MAKRIIYPPVWLAFGLVAVFALSEWLPGPRFTSASWQAVGSVVILLGLLLLVLAGGSFRRAGTDLVPFRNVSTLVTDGLFRFSRNPMYLGMALILLGCTMTTGASYALAVPVLFMVIIELRFIRPEEAMLHALFPEEFPRYCQRVRRWL